MTKNSKRVFKTLNEQEHVLARPAMYIGNPILTKKEMWIFNGEKFKYTEIEFVPALLKCCEEIIDNCLDAAIDSNFELANVIKVKITDTSVEIIDNGPGIPVAPPINGDPKGRWCPELAWTQMRAGTSFKEDRKGPSANGVGSTCVNIFCKKFKGKTDDGNLCQTVKCYNNMSKIVVTEPIKTSGKSGVNVYMEPDLERFGITEITKAHKDLLYQRLLNLAISYPQIDFYFNGKKINFNNKKFASLFHENSIVVNSDNAVVCVFPNEYDEFKHYSYVNGIAMPRGGTQIDYTINEIVNPIREKLARKYKSIRPGDIKQRLGIVVFFTDFSNPQFDAQTKDSLTNSFSDISRHYNGVIDFNDLAKKILKNDAIINPIIDTFRIKEELKARQEIKKVKRVKISADKYTPPIGEQNILALSEGQSAVSSISQCLGRNGIGYYALRGLPLNVYDQSIQKIAANQEVKDIINILNLSIAEKDCKSDISFNKIVFACDQDTDALHIISMLIGWFIKFAPHLFEQGRIFRLNTPLIILKDSRGKIIKWFFNLNEFKVWESKNDINKYKILYLKGLGSLEKEDLDYVISQVGLDGLLQELKLDKNANVYIEHWLGSDSEPRKEYLRNYTFNVDMI